MIANRTICCLGAMLLIPFFFAEIVPRASLNQDRGSTHVNYLTLKQRGFLVPGPSLHKQMVASERTLASLV
ncbi:MAG: hypothetical protein ACFFB3_18025 [Candidatus Hodarchaeota archaeon]